MENNGIGLGDAMLLAQNGGNGAWGGGCWIWVILLFFLMGGNGWGNNRNTATTTDVYAAADNQQMENSIRDVARQINQVGDGISSATFALNNTINNGFTGVMRDQFGLQNTMMGGFNNIGQAINENRFATQHGFCETNYNMQAGTAAINANATANTQKILDKLCAMEANAKDAEIANLRQALAGSELANSQQAQNAQLIAALRPFPNPAYVVANPYTAGCGCYGCAQ